MGGMRFRVTRPTSPDQFLRAAGSFLERHEAEHTTLLGLCASMQSSPEAFASDPPRFAVVHDVARRVVLAGLRTPPWNQLVSLADDADATDAVIALADALSDETLPGVLGPKPIAERFAQRWQELTGHRAELSVAERMFRLERVEAPERPAAGRLRPVEPRDRDQVAAWFVAFRDEALPEDPPIDDPLGMVDRWIDSTERTLYVWDVDGAPVAMTGATGRTRHGVRINSVYTPPESRGRGYATALVAGVSQDQLDQGRRFCVLYTDLANPTSNRIYRRIGYRPILDVDVYRFR